MILKGKAEAVAQEIIDLFEQGTLPEPLAKVYIRMGLTRHSATWSIPNQILVAKHEFCDARTFKQWKDAGRSVCKGKRAFHIIAPITRRIYDPQDEQADEDGFVTICVGYRSIPVFGFEQTEGEPIPDLEAEAQFLEELPLLEVARAWGLKVEIFETVPGGYLAGYLPGQTIRLGVENWSVWTHELIHVADERCRGDLQTEKFDREIVADLGAATLLRCLSYEEQADLGGSFRYLQGYAKKQGVPLIQACTQYLGRITDAVNLILKTAEELHQEEAA